MGFTAFAVGTGAKAIGAYKGAQAQKSADNANASIADYQAQQAILNGQTNVQTSELQTAQVKGRQRAALGANGVDLGYGSATDVLASTDLLGDHDTATIMDNALRTAWGYQTTATADRSAASQVSPIGAGFTSLLGSVATPVGMGAVSSAGAWIKQQASGAMAVIGS